MATGILRDIDRLESLPDESIRKQDQEYLVSQKVQDIFDGLLGGLLKEKPVDPIQYIIDLLQYSADEARQDGLTGLPLRRQKRLKELFSSIDQAGEGQVSQNMLRLYAGRFGGSASSQDELADLFRDIKANDDNYVNYEGFLKFFSKLSSSLSNDLFDQMMDEMTK